MAIQFRLEQGMSVDIRTHVNIKGQEEWSANGLVLTVHKNQALILVKGDNGYKEALMFGTQSGRTHGTKVLEAKNGMVARPRQHKVTDAAIETAIETAILEEGISND